jgi:hypothetical protein
MSGQESSSQKKPFQKVDRRRFDADGNQRDVAQVEVPAKPTPEATGSSNFEPSQFEKLTGAHIEQQELDDVGDNSSDGLVSEEPPASDDDVTFTSFVMSLATQTMVQLGEMQPPPGMEIPPDIESAKQSIEIIAMLQKKTNGNLSTEESRFLVDVLHTLRTSYVRRST